MAANRREQGRCKGLMKTMKHSVAFAKSMTALTVALTFTSAVSSQTIVADSSLPTPDVNSFIIMPVHCDSYGNIFLQPPLSKISPDGKRTAIFDLSAARIDGLTNLVFKAFAVDASGSLYQLVRMEDQRVVIVKFDSDGHYSGSIILNEKFEPQQLGVFTEEVFLVSGITFVRGGSSPEFAPYTAVFDRSGRLIKKVDTIEPVGTPGRGQGNAENLSGLPELGIAESQGVYVYLLRQAAAPTVFVISAAGVVDRMLKLSPPYPNTNVSGFRVGTGQLLVEYARPKALPNGNTAYYMVLYNAETGEKLSEYARDPDLGGVLGCTDWKGKFTILSTDYDGKRVLVKASKR
jgi:hypothetical protein